MAEKLATDIVDDAFATRELLAERRWAAQVLREVIVTLLEQKLEDPTESEGDIAYDIAVDHCIEAVRALAVVTPQGER